jgi:WD40 repeat protein
MYALSGLKFTPDGKTLIASGPKSKNGILFWDLETGEIVRSIDESVSNLIISNTRNLIAGITKDSIIKVWNALDGKLLYTIGSGFHNIISIDFNAESVILAAGCADNSIRTFDVDNGFLLYTYQGHSGPVTTLDICELGYYMVSGSADSTIKLWDVVHGDCIATSVNLFKPVKKVVFYEPDGTIFVLHPANSWLGRITSFDLSDFKEYKATNFYITDFSFSSDWKKLVSGTKGHSLKQWDIDSASLPVSQINHSFDITSISISPDGSKLAYSGVDSVRLYKLLNYQLLKSYPFPNSEPVVFSPDGTKLAMYDTGKESLFLVDVESGDEYKQFYFPAIVPEVDFSPNSEFIIANNIGGNYKIWEISTGEILIDNWDILCYYSKVDFSPNGLTFAMGTLDFNVNIINRNTGKVINSFDSKNAYIYCPTFHPDGKILAASGEGPYIELWDIGSGKLIRRMEAHNNSSCSINFNFDGSMLLSGGNDSTMKLWKTDTGECLYTFDDHCSWVNYVAFSPDGKLIASGSEDGTVRIYKVPPPVTVADGEGTKAVEGNISVYPNPASNSFVVNYTIQASGESSLTIRDLNSKIVRTIFDKKFLEAGSYLETVDASPLSPGMYYIFLTSPDGSESSGVIIIR